LRRSTKGQSQEFNLGGGVFNALGHQRHFRPRCNTRKAEQFNTVADFAQWVNEVMTDTRADKGVKIGQLGAPDK
jgi:hypothetical protein